MQWLDILWSYTFHIWFKFSLYSNQLIILSIALNPYMLSLYCRQTINPLLTCYFYSQGAILCSIQFTSHTHKTLRTGILSAHYKQGGSFPVSRCTKLFTVFDVNNQTHKDNVRWHVLISQSSVSARGSHWLWHASTRARVCGLWRYLRARTAVAQGLRGS